MVISAVAPTTGVPDHVHPTWGVGQPHQALVKSLVQWAGMMCGAALAGRKYATLTFVLPAPQGCDQACSNPDGEVICYIAERGEAKIAQSTDIGPEHLKKYVTDIKRGEKVTITGLHVQGYEPLLPACREHLLAILDVANELGLSVTVVTNGQGLVGAIDDLRPFMHLLHIIVSIHGVGANHNRIAKAKMGDAYVMARRGVLACKEAGISVSVSSILFQGYREWLDGLVPVLAEWDVSWTINACVESGESEIGGPVGERDMILRDLAVLVEASKKHGVVILIDDELSGLGNLWSSWEKWTLWVRTRRLRWPIKFLRLLPNGQVVEGIDFMRKHDHSSPVWSPATNAATFVGLAA